MFFFSSWSDDILKVIRPGEWVSEPVIHQRVIDLRITRGDWGLISGLLSLASPRLARTFFTFITIDRTMWRLALLVHTKDILVRETAEPGLNVVTAVEAPVFEYCLGTGATTSRATKSASGSSDPPANMAYA